MQLVFTIHVIITLLMLKPATSTTCDNATAYSVWSLCVQTNMYLKELSMRALETAEKCCEAVDSSYANQRTICASTTLLRTERGFYGWRFCPTGYYLNGFNMIQCCRPLHHPKRYGHCYDEDLMLNSGRRRCQLAGYYIKGFYKHDCHGPNSNFVLFCIRKFRCCKMTKTGKEIVEKSTTGTTSSHLQTSALTRSQMLSIALGLLAGLMTMAALIKLWYRRRRKPPASLRPPPDVNESDFKYDVFVTYSRNDFPWVDRELLRLLRENQVKYCIDHKHFELGKAIVENITDSVYQSRKVLAVWSGSYASSKYCKQELDYAIQRSFQNSDCSVIVITLDKTDRKQLPKPLQAKTFLDYSDSVERQGWEKRLIKHLKAPNYKKNSKTTIV